MRALVRDNFFVSPARPPVAFDHDLACARLVHCSTLPFIHTRICQLSSTTIPHEDIASRLVATMSTVARGSSSRGGRGRGASSGIWRGSNTRGGHDGAPAEAGDKSAFGAKKRGGGQGAPNGGTSTRSAAGTRARNNDGDAQDSDDQGRPKK